MESQKVKVSTAAQILGKSPAEVRYLMWRDIGKPEEKKDLPIGKAIKSRSGKSYRYEIYKNLLMKHVGLQEWPT